MPKNRIIVRVEGEGVSEHDIDVIRERVIASAFKDFDMSVEVSDGPEVWVSYDDGDIAFIEQFRG